MGKCVTLPAVCVCVCVCVGGGGGGGGLLLFWVLVSINGKGNNWEFSFDDVTVARSFTFCCLASSGWRVLETRVSFSAVGNYVDWIGFVFKHTNLIQMYQRSKGLHKCSESDMQWDFSLHVWCRLTVFCLSGFFSFFFFKHSSSLSSVTMTCFHWDSVAGMHLQPLH